jgi:endonuclease YncB( thermonuclease family)
MYEYRALLKEVIDGDTYVLDIDEGFRDWKHDQHLRAYGINCPEMRTEAGPVAKQYAVDWFAEHAPLGAVIIQTFPDKRLDDRSDNFGRWLARVIAQDGACLNDDLLASGNAVVYP